MSRPGTTGGDEIRALLVLEQTPGIGLRSLRALVAAFGSATRAISGKARERAAVVGRAALAGSHPEVRRAVEAGLRDASRLGMEVLTWNDVAYPARLLQLADPPPVLFLRGRAELLAGEGLTVVGARRATARGKEVAARLGAGIAAGGLNVISGLALGIDGAAHRGALDARGSTVAVLGRGADEAYPRSHRRLFARVLDEGLVVSEFLPGTPPLPGNFPRRNRILAALGGGVVVVEAGAKSGALITVDHALDLGLDVWAVPGPIDGPSCVGSNRLLLEGARPLVSTTDFFREAVGSELLTPEASPGDDGPEGRLLSKLTEGPLAVDEIADLAGLEVQEALALLAEMELGGVVEQLPGMRFRRAA